MILQEVNKPFIAFSSILKAHSLQLKQDFLTSKKLLIDYMPNENEQTLYYIASWVWSAIQHDKRSGEKDLTVEHSSHMDVLIKRICRSWEIPQINIWESMCEKDIYFSNLGISYAALLAAKQFLRKNELQSTLTEIRDYLFENGLKGGMLISSPSRKTVSTDLLAAVMPFGLFSPEDLVMVEAVKEIENRLVSNEGVYRTAGENAASPASTAWLALYFTEKGDLKKARHYYQQSLQKPAEAKEKVLTESLIEMVSFYLEEHREDIQTYQIMHNPFGHDNHYEPQATERFPKHPLEGQDVTVYAEIWPDSADELTVKVRSGDMVKEVSCSREKGSIWKANIGSFEDTEAEYIFFARKNGDVVAESDRYSFSPLKLNAVKSVAFYGRQDAMYWFEGEDLLNLSPVYIGIHTAEGLSSSFTVQFEEPFVAEKTSSSLMLDKSEVFVLYLKEYCYKLKKEPLSLQVTDYSGKILLESCTKTHHPISWLIDSKIEKKKLQFNFAISEDEKFYGFGERYNSLDQRGNVLDCYVYNQYRDQGTRTYMPVPYYISSKGYGMWINTLRLSSFDLGHQLNDLLQVECEVTDSDSSIQIHFFYGEPKQVCEQFTLQTGKPILPPVWAFGPWMSSNNWDRDSVVREQVRLTKELQIPSTVLVLEQWSDEATYYIFNDAEYEVKEREDYHRYEDYHFPEWGRWPDPKGLTDYLHENGLRLILWQIPIQKYLNRQHHLQKDTDEAYMLEKEYMVKNSDGTPYRMPEGWFKESLLMDFSSDEGKQWWFNKRQYLLDIGVDGFKTDGGEFVFGKQLQFADGRNGDEMRNQYPNDYIQAYYDFAANHKKGDAMTFSRAGYTGAQKFPAHWAGDERSTFEAFQRSLIAGLSSGLSGIPFWGWDLGGFNGDIPSAELFIRSAQMAAFCPIMQYHAESKAEFNQDRTPWNIAERTGNPYAIEGYRFFANVRMNLLPYIYHQARISSETGVPLMRPLCLEFPEDSSVKTIFDEYMFGESLLVAPVIEEGSTERNVYFPDGTWYSLWTEEVVVGPAYRRVKAPLNTIPVFVKRGTVLLMNTDETLQLGSWVGNEIDSYKTPVARIYLEDGLNVEITDHLNQVLSVEAKIVDEEWSVEISTTIGGLKLLFLESQLSANQTLTINHKKVNVSDLERLDGGWVSCKKI
ncbi:TIM-barrel domain-containing protein [Fictibacillus aquaticus]|uniref:Uncharacterized protein n=1 Tax=Fictibacillus aquaticus TaxID=2021314 RepID=A0A235F903_9BACL|nr:TIM-barrel domain-containing protein [Fictibacillus aquaticus]OYD57649.1 hypothetical protein CGZ90_13370 [Fictibacillus aquaticus]